MIIKCKRNSIKNNNNKGTSQVKLRDLKFKCVYVCVMMKKKKKQKKNDRRLNCMRFVDVTWIKNTLLIHSFMPGMSKNIQ